MIPAGINRSNSPSLSISPTSKALRTVARKWSYWLTPFPFLKSGSQQPKPPAASAAMEVPPREYFTMAILRSGNRLCSVSANVSSTPNRLEYWFVSPSDLKPTPCPGFKVLQTPFPSTERPSAEELPWKIGTPGWSFVISFGSLFI